MRHVVFEFVFDWIIILLRRTRRTVNSSIGLKWDEMTFSSASHFHCSLLAAQCLLFDHWHLRMNNEQVSGMCAFWSRNSFTYLHLPLFKIASIFILISEDREREIWEGQISNETEVGTPISLRRYQVDRRASTECVKINQTNCQRIFTLLSSVLAPKLSDRSTTGKTTSDCLISIPSGNDDHRRALSSAIELRFFCVYFRRTLFGTRKNISDKSDTYKSQRERVSAR